MRTIRRSVLRPFVIFAALISVGFGAEAQPGRYPGGRGISWQRVQAPFTPGNGAIVGGPGDDPAPGTPMYVCRAQDGGSLVPGKWVRGSCNVAFNGSEDVMGSYEVAYGNANWGGYQGSTDGLIQTGNEPDGSPLYSCRVRYRGGFPPSDVGNQPGKLVSDGTCHIPIGGQEVTVNRPFEVLYGGGGGYPPYPYPYPYPYPPPPAPAPQPYQPGPSSVTWQPAQSPYVPVQGAVIGGPGNGPKPGAPLYVCRATSGSALYPGKWIEGQCSITSSAREQKMNTYEVAMGPAEWRTFDGDVGALVPGGYDQDGTPLYICRIHYKMFGDKGMQPGRLTGGKCLVPYAGVELASAMPFEALYNVFPATAPAVPSGEATGAPQPAVPEAAGAQAHGLLVSFTGGTTEAAGTASVTNGGTGKTVTKALPANSTAEACVLVLQQAAFEAGLQIQAQPDGKGLRVFGINNAVNVTQAAVAVSQF